MLRAGPSFLIVKNLLYGFVFSGLCSLCFTGEIKLFLVEKDEKLKNLTDLVIQQLFC